MTKTIIFDCFGVLVADSLGLFYGKYIHNHPGKIIEIDSIAERSNRGEITYSEFEEGVSIISGVDLKVVSIELAKNPRNVGLLEYINLELNGKYKIAMLSNASDNWINELFTSKDIKMFDDTVLSFQVGLAKPDARIFELAATRLGVEPEECVFIDDLEKYLVGAKKAGMKTIKYADFESFKEVLERQLINEA